MLVSGALSLTPSAAGGVWYGGRGLHAGGSTANVTIDYITIATPSNSTDFGDLTASMEDYGSGCSDSSRGVWGGGYRGGWSNIIDYITIATTGNATDFGNLTQARRENGACSDGTKGVWAGGWNGGYLDTIDYITIQTTGNATDFGDLTRTSHRGGGMSGD